MKFIIHMRRNYFKNITHKIVYQTYIEQEALFSYILIFNKLSFKKERSRRTIHLQRISIRV